MLIKVSTRQSIPSQAAQPAIHLEIINPLPCALLAVWRGDERRAIQFHSSGKDLIKWQAKKVLRPGTRFTAVANSTFSSL